MIKLFLCQFNNFFFKLNFLFLNPRITFLNFLKKYENGEELDECTENEILLC